ncbi:helicase-related protein [Aeoliella sp. SH292]|uniref:helicase-related protein n=1 Tax=Aeoliella sp. SH292 TaxID=3454464 RepID=UPI003F94D948
MPRRQSQTGSELFIVDNSEEDWKVSRYLRDWCELSKSIDVATGYFEIGSLLHLDGEWQKVDNFRILMGDEVSKRTKKAFEAGLAEVQNRLDLSLEREKLKNDFLEGVPAIVESLRAGTIQCRVYRKDKFHAKCYLTHARQEVVGSFGLVGSSNFTLPGITQNLELNVQITGTPVAVLQEWYEQHWNNAEDVTPEILRTIERHIELFTPFDVYAKALQEFFKGHEQTVGEWEREESTVYPLLAQYQREAYHALMKRGHKYNGAFLCDGVGLGKTFVGLMLIERLIKHDRKKVALIVPKSGREAVWEATLRKYLPELFGRFNNLEIFNHSDLLRRGLQEDLDSVRDRADVVLIDEAHHFRNTGTKGEDPNERKSRYWRLFDIIGDKTVFLLTATPVNNRLVDFQHMVELFSRHEPSYFSDAPLGIHSLAGHIRKLESEIEASLTGKVDAQVGLFDMTEADQIMGRDDLFRELVVQRSRAYVVESMETEDGSAMFPEPRKPKVAEYSVKQTYGKLLKMVEEAFQKQKPLFSLAIYYPLHYYIGNDATIDKFAQGRQQQVVSLIRTIFLKRFESSAEAFKQSCWTLLKKLLAWVTVHAQTDGEKGRLERWKAQNAELIDHDPQTRLFTLGDEPEEDFIEPELLEAVEQLDREEYQVGEIISETMLDLDQVAEFLKELEQFKPSQDKKLTALKNLLNKDTVLKQHKVLIFTEFMTTARYLREQLVEAGINGVEEIDSATSSDGRVKIIRRFAPYYNGSSSGKLADEGLDEIRVLISTDVLSEGLNLQDCTRLINYDLHWNPVRLMQRIGRVDRRMNPHIEAAIVADHPDQESLRGTVAYWNFLPPDELNDLLSLYKTVTHKTLRISKTLGIEGGRLLTPDDDFEDLKNFNERYKGTKTPEEEMHLELQRMLKENPGLEVRLNELPDRIFSGRERVAGSSRGVFFCYARPAADSTLVDEDGNPVWTLAAGDVAWYLYDLATGKILEDPAMIVEFIRSTPTTPRRCQVDRAELQGVREKLDKHVKNTYLKKVQAPLGVMASLRAWMELN